MVAVTGISADAAANMIDLGVARCILDLPQPHLDRHFDYAIPDGMSSAAVPGARVSVRFGGRDVPGYLIERRADTDHTGRLIPLRRVISAEPVLTPQVLALCRAVADRYAGSLSDVLRLAVPPRHATTEKASLGPTRSPDDTTPPPAEQWQRYRAGAAFITRVAAGEAPRAVWTALPGMPHVAAALAEAIAAALDSARGAVVVLPDRRDVDVLDAALVARLGPGRHVRLEADLGPAARYKAFLACLRGEVQVVIGTRAAAFAPVRDVGLIAIWDDGDEQFAEPRAPYPHALEVVRLRAEQEGAAVLIGGWVMSADSAALVESGWARVLAPERDERRRSWPQVSIDDPEWQGARSRISESTWRVIREGLTRGSVLVQVPRAGYIPALACGRCRHPARCRHCAGPIQLTDDNAESRRCGWCGRDQHGWVCPHCGASALRAVRIGVERTADELGRAFPGVPVVVSRPERRLPVIGDRASVVLATPGIEPPPPPSGYAAAVLLDGNLLLARPDLRAGEDALRRWAAAAAAVRSSAQGGRVVLSADPASRAAQGLVRNDPAGFAQRELAERAELKLPPAARLVALQGPSGAVASLAAAVVRALAERAVPKQVIDLLGPIPIAADESKGPGADAGEADLDALLPEHDPLVRTVVRVPLDYSEVLLRVTRAALVTRSAQREPGLVRVQVDPRDLG